MCLTGWGALACHAPLGSDVRPVVYLSAAQQSPIRGRPAAHQGGAPLQCRGRSDIISQAYYQSDICDRLGMVLKKLTELC